MRLYDLVGRGESRGERGIGATAPPPRPLSSTVMVMYEEPRAPVPLLIVETSGTSGRRGECGRMACCPASGV